jgi:GntR family transcriptional regulator / MocR family aminotransferase
VYRRRRDALVDALAEELPDAAVQGVAAGLHAAVRLGATDDEQAIFDEASSRRLALLTLQGFHAGGSDRSRATLLLGYSQSREPTIRRAVAELAETVRAVRGRL